MPTNKNVVICFFRGRSLQTFVSVTRRESSVFSPTPSSSTLTRRAPGCIWRNRRSSSNTYSSSWRKKIKEHKPVQHPQQEIIWNIHRTENENAYELLPCPSKFLVFKHPTVSQPVYPANLPHDPRSSTWTRQARVVEVGILPEFPKHKLQFLVK